MVEWEDAEELENQQTASFKKFFTPSKTAGPRRHPYFAERKLKSTTKIL